MKQRRKKILVLAANPQGQSPLRLDQEIREIQAGLRSANRRDDYELIQRLAVRPRDLQQALISDRPNIVHFSGHGSKEGEIYLENEFGQSHPVPADALTDLFEICSSHVEGVLLNACYAEIQATAIVRHIPYVVGMSTAISDKAAVQYAIGFYDALGAGLSFDEAHKVGCNLLKLLRIPEHLTPVLKKSSNGSSRSTDFAVLGRMTRDEINSAIQQYKATMAMNGEDGDAHYTLGLLYLQLRLYDLAIRHLKRAVDLDPDNADAYYYLALGWIRGRRPKVLTLQEIRAIEDYLNAAIQLDERPAKYYYCLAAVRHDYYSSNGLSSPSPPPHQLLMMAQGKEYDAWEVERLLGSLTLRDENLVSQIRRS